MRVFYNFRYKFNNDLPKKSFFFFLNSYFLIHLSFFLVLFSYFSCEETTKPKTVSFSGTVTLLDPTGEEMQDHSAVNTFLYKPIYLNTFLSQT